MKNFRRIIALLMVLLVCSQSFAAVVSDNDGSAFITKAEFDSLKNNFQAQIDNYNQSIDSKIDGAIASYLAGIKVNTDDTPEFRVWGKDAGFWTGKKCNRFYVCEIGTACSGNESTASSGNFVFLESSSKTDRGYGYAWWVNAYANKSSVFMGGDDVGFSIGVGNAWPASPASYSSGKSTRLFYKTGTPATGGASSTFISNKNDPQLPKALASKGLSDIFNSVISIWQPSFTLFEFLDPGDVTLNFGIQRNGRQYEGGARGGTDGNPGFVDGTDGSGVCVFLNHAGTKTKMLDLSLNAGKPEGAWNVFTCTVSPGDTITLDCTPKASSSSSLTYSIFYFSNQIPGWEIATT